MKVLITFSESFCDIIGSYSYIRVNKDIYLSYSCREDPFNFSRNVSKYSYYAVPFTRKDMFKILYKDLKSKK